ncbi:hypothetical protein CUJ84_pRLN2000244 (plasmid) [Rhizobium leguminosarum]|uniref:Uncharacterized protein n=1 Tax=Rhizobium leguminosarum TaxID=384 RepID=A0A2K9ZEZ1_RHILE|nr:hypothetical protein CUJ84_pRLN2000244 [Rhizobium leguminosarum]
MDSDQNGRTVCRMQDMAALWRQLHLRPEQRIKRACAERHDKFRLQDVELCAEPPGATPDLTGIRLCMQPPFAARRELEVLDGIGDIAALSVEIGLFQAAIEQLAGGTDKGPAAQILLIARLLADENDLGFHRTFAEDDLRGIPVEITTGTAFCLMPEFGNACGVRNFERQGRADISGYVHDGDPHLLGINRSVPGLFPFGNGQRAFEICGPIPELFAIGSRAGKMVTVQNFASWESRGAIERRRFAAIFASDVLSPIDLLAAYPLCRFDRHGGRGGDPCRYDQGGGARGDRLGRRHHSVSDHRCAALCDCRHQSHPPQIAERPS